mgnify:CR=1 FL=1
MKLTDGDLKRVLDDSRPGREALAAERDSPSWHPDAEMLARAITGGLSGDEQRRVAAHIAECAACAGECRSATSMKPWAERATSSSVGAEESVARQRRAGFRSWIPVMAVAGLALLVVVVVPRLRPGGPGDTPRPDAPPVERAGESAPIVVIVAPTDQARISPAVPLVFTWEAFAEAEAYDVVVQRSDASTVWRSPRASSPSITMPADLALSPGRYYWQVSAYRGGTVIASSRLSRFDLRE